MEFAAEVPMMNTVIHALLSLARHLKIQDLNPKLNPTGDLACSYGPNAGVMGARVSQYKTSGYRYT
jgi:hypothetical protein